MKERPILFDAQMVRALLAGTKTQTRRAATLTANAHVKEPGGHRRWHPGDPDARLACPYGQPGDRLWVRETWAAPHSDDARPPRSIHCDWTQIHYAATEERGGLMWRPSIHMPRWASRITLEITGVRVERLQDISADDVRSEGCPDKPIEGAEQASIDLLAKLWYHDLWESINGSDSWNANPWVWVLEFKRVEGVAS
ncbi:hypothetical protein C6P61_09580 [Malikia spinosa]|uniref:Morphogenetic protein n=1 Tax=Malikia spinosa TaxID=86180 RepID=A0A2S9KEB4_9BURK|nr:hypothetical protein [Malikia spinosa]PRD68742.1 hypothetical protein C6P61_09580 [Malikia spinosa]